MILTRRILLTLCLVAAAVCAPSAKAAAPPSNQWMVILNEPPAVKRYPGRFQITRATAEPYRQHLRQVQAGLRSQIEARHVHVTGGIQHLMNGLFVVASPAQAAALRNLPGVKSVVPLRWYHRKDQLSLSNVAAAWNSSGVGGASNAGAGLFVGVIDTGIDQNNPSFQQSLPAPGFPIATTGQSGTATQPAFMSNKVIVARSYVSYLATSDVTDTTNPAGQSRPDDYSARDLIGHGTAVSSVIAGAATTVGGIPVSGVAPMAYLGNYKVFGSDEVNPGASSAGLMAAVEDAVSDGVNVLNLSLGGLPYSGPLDQSCNGPCDPLAYQLETAVENGSVVVVAAAGNSGNIGYQYNFNSSSLPTLVTMSSPAYEPSLIAAGGIQNDVTYTQSVDLSGSGVPANIQKIAAVTSFDGPDPASPYTAPAVDVTQAGDSDGLLCSAISPGALSGKFALLLRGTCTFAVKVGNAQNAGALGIIIIDNGTGLSPWSVGSAAVIPAYLVSQTDGSNLKTYIDANSGASVTLNPSPFQAPASSRYVEDKCFPSSAPPPTEALLPKSVACFASLGPIFGVGAQLVKPDAAAAATDFLLAAQNYDPAGELFSFNQYATADGTSFSTPMFSGSAALVIQANPSFSPLQVKSALVNTASASGLKTTDGSAAAPQVAVGAGLLQTQNAVASTVQFIPSSVYFGVLNGLLPTTGSITVLNSGSANVTLNLSAAQPAGLSNTQLLVNGAATASFTLPAGGSTTMSVGLSGSVPGPGRYEGAITATGAGSITYTLPVTFLVGDGVPFDIIPLNETPPGYIGFDGPVNATVPWYQVPCTAVNSCVLDYGSIAIQVVDQYGAPVPGTPVDWSVTGGDGSILQGGNYTDTTTDINGLAGASVVLGSTPGTQEFTATVNGMSMPFDGNARAIPAINAGGILDAASFVPNRAVAPGSWIAVYGANLSDVTDYPYGNCLECSPVNQPLPLGLDGVAFSFDTGSLSLPGRFFYVSPGQLNVQVPWELVGQTSATVKVIVNYTYSATMNLPIAEYSPGFFVVNYTTQEAAALLPNYTLVSSSNPVPHGTPVLLYLNGMGPVNVPPGDGMASACATLNNCKTTTLPTVMIGNQQATVDYSGLAPGLVGYQINAEVPAGVSTGLQPITVTVGGVTSKTAYIYVQ